MLNCPDVQILSYPFFNASVPALSPVLGINSSLTWPHSEHSNTCSGIIVAFPVGEYTADNFLNITTCLNVGFPQALQFTSSHVYEENPNKLIANVASSSFSNHSASFRRQVYISRVALYDDKKNLIGIATLSNPVLKEEDQDYTFKLKLDI